MSVASSCIDVQPTTTKLILLDEGQTKSKSDKSNSGDENMSKKDLTLQESIDQIKNTFGKGSIMWLGGSETRRHVPVVSTGSINLDIALGIGGFPKGCVIEVYGSEASGKTTLALHVIAEAQKHRGYCAFLDADNALDPALAESIGVNTQNLLLSRPECGEQALSLVDSLIRTGCVDVVVIDSVRPKKWPQQKFGGATDVTYGGNALKLYASVRLNIRRTEFVKKGEKTVGSQVLVKVIKNKHAPPFRTAEFNIEFGKGICRDAEIINLGVEHKLLTKKGSVYKINGETLQGRDALRQYLTDNPALKDELLKKLQEILMSSTGASEVELSENEEEAVSADAS